MLSALVSVAVFLVPVAASVASAAVVARTLPRPHGAGGTLGWWALVLAVPTVVLVVVERTARRALPLAVLLKMTMVFPDRAPRRLAVARRAGTTRDLARRIAEAKEGGIASEPVRAAEKILALAGALNAHDRMTRGHAERVRALTDLIAEELDLPTAARDRLRWSALLHDIGKLAVHPDVLNKPGGLDEHEWEVIRTHPLEGAKLVAPLAGWLGEWANSIAEHHEKYDGTGYPFGLSGAEISLGGRIVSVADCYDTMTAVRTYKDPMSPTAARAELAACAGSHFDPDIVRAFLAVSLGKVRWAGGPLAWLASLPFVSNVTGVAQLGSVLGRVGAAAATGVGAVTFGVLHGVTATGSPVHPPMASGQPPGAHPRGRSSPGDRTGVPTGDPGSTVPVRSTGSGGVDAPGAQPAPTGGQASTTGDLAGGGGQAGTTAGGPASDTAGTGGSGTGGSGTGGTVTTTTTRPSGSPPPVVASLSIRNGGGVVGSPDQGDQIVVTFAVAPDPGLFCSAWGNGAYPDLAGPDVSVMMTHPHAADEEVSSVKDTSACTGGFHFGTIDLGQAGYLKSTATFGGGASQCSGTVSTGCTTLHWDGRNTLTVTLGATSATELTVVSPSVAVYTPDPALGLTGTIASKLETHF